MVSTVRNSGAVPDRAVRCAMLSSPRWTRWTASSATRRISAPDALAGPRHDPNYPIEKLDTYENFVLLCKIHHKLVDDNEEVFTTEILVETKHRHERRVNAALSPKAKGWIHDVLFYPITNGTELMRIAAQAYVYVFEHDHPETDAERETIGAFLEGLRDWGDIADDIGPGGQVNGAEDLHRQMLELQELGFVVVAGIGDYRLQPDLVVPAAAVRVTRLSADRDSPGDVPPGNPAVT